MKAITTHDFRSLLAGYEPPRASVAEQAAHREASAVAQYVAATSSGRTSDDVADVARAVVEGRVRVLLHAQGEHVWGRL
ncbi:MAG: hypothetical protein ACJ79M_10900, partial [Myxococcales bacterium]